MLSLLFFLVTILPFSTEGGEIRWGTEVKRHSWPYMAFIHFYDIQLVRRFCGGFLVQEDFVMTAAHCYGSKMNVTLGAHNINKKENSWQEIPVLKAIPHKEYNKKSKVNDIMLLKLKYKAQLNKYVNTIALPKSQDWVRTGQVCSVAGWGKMANGKNSNTLQKVDLEVQDEQKCKDIFCCYNNSIQLCVGNPQDKKATDRGDSGGPFVCNNVTQGIVSYQHKTGKLPRVFTRISSFVPWIQTMMKLFGPSRMAGPMSWASVHTLGGN